MTKNTKPTIEELKEKVPIEITTSKLTFIDTNHKAIHISNDEGDIYIIFTFDEKMELPPAMSLEELISTSNTTITIDDRSRIIHRLDADDNLLDQIIEFVEEKISRISEQVPE